MWRGAVSDRTRDIVRRLVWFLALWVGGIAVVGAVAFVLRRVLL